MADVGVIQTRDVQSGYRSPDTRATSRAIGNALDGVEKVVKGAILGGVEDEIVGDLKERVEDLSNPADPMGPPEDRAGTDTEAQRIRNRVNKLINLRDQGTTSQKTLAEMQLKQTISDASVKYPWLREDLLRRAGLVSQLSVELDQLGFYDAAMEAQASNAQSQLKALQDHATKDWDEGGLGLDPSIPLGSVQWAHMYADRQALRSADTQRQMLLTTRELDATALLETAGTMFQGKLSGARSAIEGIWQRNGLYEAIDSAMKGEQGDPEVLRVFKQSGAQTVVADLMQLNANMTSVFEQVLEPRYRNTEDGKVLKAMLDDFIAQNNKSIQLTQDMANGVPGAAAHLDSLRAVRSSNLYRGNTEAYKDFEAWVSDPGHKTMLEVAGGDLTASGQVFRQQLASTATAVLSNLNPTVIGPDASPGEQAAMAYVTSGQGAVVKGSTASEVISTLEKHQRDSDTPFYVPGGTSRNDQVGAATTIELHSELWRKAREIDGKASPYKAATFATGLTYGFLGLAKETNRPEDLDQLELENMASSDTLEIIEVMGDGEYTGQRRALGMAMKDYYTTTKPAERRNKSIQAYNTTKIGDTPLSEMALIDVRKMSDDGIISYKENKDAIDREVSRRIAQDTTVGFSTPSKVKVENEVKNEIADAMAPIVNHVQQDLNIEQNIRVAIRPSFERNEGSLRAKYFDELGWLDGFNYTTIKD